MKYTIKFSDQVFEDADKLERDEPKAFRKFDALLRELEDHPRTGTGHPEPLKGNRSGQWSRRISKKHRLIYSIHDDEVVVLVIAAYGHYEEK